MDLAFADVRATTADADPSPAGVGERLRKERTLTEVPEIRDPLFQEAVTAIDAGDVGALERLIPAHPELVRDRLEGGEGYFRRPYLLWFVAENPVRSDRLPKNIADVTRVILREAKKLPPDTFREQVDYALALVCSGRVPRECGVQLELIDVLTEAGADPNGAVLAALAHREVAALQRLIERGATATLPLVIGAGRQDELPRLARTADARDRQLGLTTAALYGNAPALAALIDLGVDVAAYSPAGFHDHATPLHHAVDSGSLDAVKLLVEAGAPLDVTDRVYDGTPLDWAVHLGRAEIAAYLRDRTLPLP